MKAKFKIGDRVRVTNDCIAAKKGTEFAISYIQFNKLSKTYSYSDYRAEKKVIPPQYVIPENELELVNHTGKILIMVDEHDNNKIIARDLITGKTAEAKCNPKDEWDFNTGAKLALERLTEPEKPKYWNGKVVLASADNNSVFFTIGKIYPVIDGQIIDNSGSHFVSDRFASIKDLQHYFTCLWPVGNRKFVEYKGEVTPSEQ